MRSSAWGLCVMLWSSAGSAAAVQTSNASLRGIVDARTGVAIADVTVQVAGSTAVSLADAARGYTRWEAFGTWRIGWAAINLTIDNLFDVNRNEAQFATTSHLFHEIESVNELHFTPGSPRSISWA